MHSSQSSFFVSLLLVVLLVLAAAIGGMARDRNMKKVLEATGGVPMEGEKMQGMKYGKSSGMKGEGGMEQG